MKIDINENISKLTTQMNDFRSELLRLEGSLRTLQNMKEMGVETIEVKSESIINTTEIVDNVQG